MHVHDALVCGRKSTASVENASRRSVKDVPGTSNIKSKSHRDSSVKREAT
jgi:hypothetical protein